MLTILKETDMNFLTRLVFGLFLGVPTAHAMSISPILVDLSTQKKVASVTLTNTSDKSLMYQVTSLSWSQVEGENKYLETKDLLVVPAMIEIPAGFSQVFRVTPRHPMQNSIEQSYRLILENVTVDNPNDSLKANSVIFRISHDIPVFLAPTAKKINTSRWSRCDAPVGKGCIRIENIGNERIRVSEIKIQGIKWQKDLKVIDTVLAGAWKQWLYDLPANNAMPDKVQLKTEIGVMEPIQGP